MEPGFAPGSFFAKCRSVRIPGDGEGKVVMKPIPALSAPCLVALLLVACSAMNPEQIEDRTEPGVGSVAGPTNEASGAQSMQPMLERIRADAAERVGVAPDQVKVLSVESVTWSDGSLGCPEPGMMYT